VKNILKRAVGFPSLVGLVLWCWTLWHVAVPPPPPRIPAKLRDQKKKTIFAEIEFSGQP